MRPSRIQRAIAVRSLAVPYVLARGHVEMIPDGEPVRIAALGPFHLLYSDPGIRSADREGRTRLGEWICELDVWRGRKLLSMLWRGPSSSELVSFAAGDWDTEFRYQIVLASTRPVTHRLQ